MKKGTIFVLTGAGISAESGLGTFRDKDGLWTKYPLEEVASRQGYERNPQRVLDFYNLRRGNLEGARPNAAHFALAQAEAKLAERGRSLFLVTQNVDDLHEQAGSRLVVHMHGELRKQRCEACGRVSHFAADLTTVTVCEPCGAAGRIRPDIVWFGEIPYHQDLIADALGMAELFVSIGTSGSVYPAAGYVWAAKQMGIPRMELNLEPSENAEMFTDALYGPASTVVPQWVEQVVRD